MLLHNSSYHPNSLRHSIPYSQALRINRICSNKNDVEKYLNVMQTKFLECGYDESTLKSQLDKAINKDRKYLLKCKEPAPSGQRAPFITTYNKHLPDIKSVFEKTWNILQINPKQATLFKDKPVIAYKRNQNLRELLTKHKLVET
jgi:hypothetical protein